MVRSRGAPCPQELPHCTRNQTETSGDLILSFCSLSLRKPMEDKIHRVRGVPQKAQNDPEGPCFSVYTASFQPTHMSTSPSPVHMTMPFPVPNTCSSGQFLLRMESSPSLPGSLTTEVPRHTSPSWDTVAHIQGASSCSGKPF